MGPRLPWQAGAAAPPLVTTEEGDVWHATVQQLIAQDAITALVRELALQSQLMARDEGHWLLRVERDHGTSPRRANACARRWRPRAMRARSAWSCGVVSDSPARRNAQAASARQRAAGDIVHNDPMCSSWMRDFGRKSCQAASNPA